MLWLDLIRIDDEVMRVISVGVGNVNNILVQRQQLGTTLDTSHNNGSTVTKMTGSYNITGSTITFVDSSLWSIPLSTTSSAF